MIYTCNACHFTFYRVGEVESCPDCGKPALREATGEEQAVFKENQAHFKNNEE